MRHLATAEPAGSWLERATCFHETLKAASSACNLNITESSYVRPHLVRKLLLKHWVTSDCPAVEPSLSWQQFLELKLPDQSQFLIQLPPKCQNVWLLQELMKCPALLLSCFLCLASGALKKRPSLLRELDKETVSQDLQDYVSLHGFPPSLERLFTWKIQLPAGSSSSKAPATESDAEDSDL